MCAEWLVPFKGRNISCAYEQNFLWRNGTTYIMDNHRAALWCWLQHLQVGRTYNLLHIDKHYDCLNSRMEAWVTHYPADVQSMSIAAYLDHSCRSRDSLTGKDLVFRWDNYLSIFLQAHSSMLKSCLFATHREGDPPNVDNLPQIEPWYLPLNLDHWMSDGDETWICNLDLDYFFMDDKEHYRRLFSVEYVKSLFDALKMKLQNNRIAVFTLCLSPECCGGWSQAEGLLNEVCSLLEIDFSLP